MAYNVSYNVGTKFNEDGSVRFFPGNTIISMIDHNTKAFAEFQKVRAMFQAMPASRCMTYLPDSSIHMTVFAGVCNQWRSPEKWTRALPLDCKLSEVDDFFEKKFAQVAKLGEVHMQAEKIVNLGGFSIHFLPETQKDADELCRYRDAMAEAFSLRFANHDTFKYHISIGYFTHEPTPEECEQIEAFPEEATAYIATRDVHLTLQTPQLTFFNDMFCFHPFRIPRNGL